MPVFVIFISKPMYRLSQKEYYACVYKSFWGAYIYRYLSVCLNYVLNLINILISVHLNTLRHISYAHTSLLTEF